MLANITDTYIHVDVTGVLLELMVLLLLLLLLLFLLLLLLVLPLLDPANYMSHLTD